MKAYFLSLVIGVLVGVIYSFFGVRSPAPPVIALVGLLGILAGEQLPPLIKQVWFKDHAQVSGLTRQVEPRVSGELPEGEASTQAKVAADRDAPTDQGPQ